MPLSDREQKILAEIERHFYEEDPALVRAVRNIDRRRRSGLRLPLFGVIAGLIGIGATFTTSTLLAIVGFGVLVVSATFLVHAVRARQDEAGKGGEEDSSTRRKIRRRFGRG